MKDLETAYREFVAALCELLDAANLDDNAETEALDFAEKISKMVGLNKSM